MNNTLILERTLAAPRAAIWRCWTEPELLKQWFCPKPWATTHADMQVHAGGRFFTRMEGPGPDGALMVQNGPGVYLEVIHGEKLVFTDAFDAGWIPTGFNCADPDAKEPRPFMLAVVTFADAPGGFTAYRAEARHWTAADKAQHEAMGFEAGWGAAADQLEALAQSIA
jgi:uncharacterized protein YndB with AHSA1/START domain